MKLSALILLLLSFIYLGELANLPDLCAEAEETCLESSCGMIETGEKECTNSNDCKDEDEEASCFNCPLNYLSTFVERFRIIVGSKLIPREYFNYSDQLTSPYIADTWKPPNTSL